MGLCKMLLLQRRVDIYSVLNEKNLIFKPGDDFAISLIGSNISFDSTDQ